MCPLAIIALLLELVLCAPQPLRVTIDCGSNEDPAQYSNPRSAEILRSRSRFDVNSFCHMIHQAIPKTIQNGRFILLGSDQEGENDNQIPIAISPPKSYIPSYPKFRAPKIGVPKLKVPKKQHLHELKAPKVGSPKLFTARNHREQDSSAERMEKFKKGIQKMLHVVKVLGQIDQYLSERTRIIVDKLSKTFAE